MLDCGTDSTEESRIWATVPIDVGLAVVAVDTAKIPVSGIHQDFRLIGCIGAELLITLLHTNNFDPIAQPVLHLGGGLWVPGPNAPGPGKLRPAAFPRAS